MKKRKKKNKKHGFTLVELIAMLTVLGIIMLIAIPNISGMLAQQKILGIKQDATKMTDIVKVKMSSNDSIKKPNNMKCIAFTLKYLNVSDDFTKGPNNNPYLEYNSFVLMCRNNTKYEYFIRLAEDNLTNLFGINTFNNAWVNYDMITNEENNPNNYINTFNKSSYENDTIYVTGKIKEKEDLVLQKLASKAQLEKQTPVNYTAINNLDREVLLLKDNIESIKKNGIDGKPGLITTIKDFISASLPSPYTKNASTIEEVYT